MDDIQISRSIKIRPIKDVCEKYDIGIDDLEFYGKYKAKVSDEFIKKSKKLKKGKLILVTATNPTPLGEGKTTISIGLSQAFEKIGKKSVLALREPSLGPCFGIKGGAAGGGYSQLIPMEDLNFHFTGDFHAITYANNLLASAIDNHIHHGNLLNIDLRRITWRRCIDLNDRALRKVLVGLGGKTNGFIREDGFDITVASEIMAILCLSKDLNDLKERLDNIVIGYDIYGNDVKAKQLGVVGAMQALLKDAIKPNLIQTIEGGLAIVHGGPFANIAHGCNSIIATELAQNLGEYAITEAGFGADLGAEKFFDIKCRLADIKPSYIVIVTTVKSIKYNGGMDTNEIYKPSLSFIDKGIGNLKRHIENLKKFGYDPIIALNHFSSDSDDEIAHIKKLISNKLFICDAYLKGGSGLIELAEYIDSLDEKEKTPNYIYDLDDSVIDKIEKVCKNYYHAKEVLLSSKAEKEIKKILNTEAEKFPICIAKTQYSFTDNPKILGEPKGFTINISDIYVNYGAKMVVVLSGNIMRMPGLPKNSAAERIYVNDNGQIEGLS